MGDIPLIIITEHRTCPSGHKLPVGDFRFYVKLKVEEPDDSKLLLCPKSLPQKSYQKLAPGGLTPCKIECRMGGQWQIRDR